MPITKSVRWVVPQGATFVAEVTFVDPDASSMPVDLTGCAARMQARAAVADADPPLYSTDSGVGGHLVLGGTAGTVTLTIPATVTAAWTFTRAVFDLEVELPSGVVHRLVKGELFIDPEVTR